MKKIWIDLTELETWPFHHTGIQRVVYNLAKNFKELNNVSFFYFNNNNQKFEKYNFIEYVKKYENSRINNLNLNIQQEKVNISFKLKVYRFIPETYRLILTPILKKNYYKLKNIYNTFKKFLLFPLNLIKYIKKFIIIKLKKPKTNLNFIQYFIGDELIFEEGDSILEFGRYWENESIFEKVINLKIKYKLKIFFIVYDFIPAFKVQAFDISLFKKYTKMMFESISHASGLFCISESTKADLLKFINISLLDTPPIKVIRLGDDIEFNGTSIKPKLINDYEFLLIVGTFEARKNHQILYYVWKEAYLRGIKLPKIVIVGSRGWYTNDLIHTIIHDSEVNKDFIILNNCNDQELLWLYQNCLFTLFVSYYEGWGLSVAESLAFGKICISSKTSSMPEIINNLLPVVSPFDSNAILNEIQKYLNPEIRIKMEENIKKNYKITKWEDTYKQLKNYLLDLV